MITYDNTTGMIRLCTDSFEYVMAVDGQGWLLHVRYGALSCGELTLPQRHHDPGCCPDMLPLEHSSRDAGDYRVVPLDAEYVAENGNTYSAADFRFRSAELLTGKPAMDGMPHFHGDCEGIRITLAAEGGAVAELIYCLFADCPLITRSTRVINEGTVPLRLLKVSSVMLDFPADQPLDFITFNGDWACERTPERAPLRYGVQSVSSGRGIPGHRHNPFAVLCAPETDEHHGDAYGVALVYSGNFSIEAHRHAAGSRLVAGINSEGFEWILEPGQCFQSPEAAVVFSPDGLGGMSRAFHDAIRSHLLRRPWSDMSKERPVLINSWEAAYFDFDEDRLLRLARQAKHAGADLFVLDDGWFEGRKDDTTSLGDWFADSEKFPDGLASFSRRLKDMGMKFGLWIEPEAISENSRLYRLHPDWALSTPVRAPLKIRNQLTLDFSREDVREYIWQCISRLVDDCGLSYIKWDMNRSLADVCSSHTKRGELYHRYVLGVYELQERLCSTYPELLLENCSGGGARFDCGMLYYSPQIWCSDNTDAYSRAMIQYGTSFCYPPACMGAHFSAVPNHTTKRSASVEDRMAAALAGTYGFEMDMTACDRQQLEEIRRYTDWYRIWGKVVRSGDLYRLSVPDEQGASWLVVSKDRQSAVLFCVGSSPAAVPPGCLDPAKTYRTEQLCANIITMKAEEQ